MTGPVETSANPRQEAACHGRGRRHRRRSPSGSRRYTGSGRSSAMRATRPAGPAVELAQRLAPLARGEVAAFVVAEQPLRLPDIGFRDAAGAERHLADWRGRTVLLNLWATWCVPCRKEMPALDALEGKLGGPAIRGGRDQHRHPRPRQAACLAQGRRHRPARLLRRPQRQGLSGLEDRRAARPACRRRSWSIRPAARSARVAGPAEWASEDALKLISAALARPS